MRFTLAHLRRRCCRCMDWKPIKGGAMVGGGRRDAKRFVCGSCK